MDNDDLLCFAALIVVVVAILLFGALINNSVNVREFDQNFFAEKITIESNTIKLSEEGTPRHTQYTGYVPAGGSILESPRLYKVTDCKGFTLNSGVTAIKAATNFSNPELISIQMPERPSGFMNICVPKGAELEIILWIVK